PSTTWSVAPATHSHDARQLPNKQACGARHKPCSTREDHVRPFHRVALTTPVTSPTSGKFNFAASVK
ncbi:hypothetical protein A2U01_0114883, partial [Trifolium medium]|nr:hypothetical protein [Trifolium medium]